VYYSYLKNRMDLTWTGRFGKPPAELKAWQELKLVSEITVRSARKGTQFCSPGRFEGLGEAATIAALRALYVSGGKVWDGFWSQPHRPPA